ncbi:hypothetical protein BGW80DRAFT_1348747 [Lactifluus volemus]|nr:hypothetical protein BGW80DRAFT_1348747 [Lactifluus volemus]
MMHRQQRVRVDNKNESLTLQRGPPPLSSESRRGAACTTPGYRRPRKLYLLPTLNYLFFRGVDAARLMFDVNQPATLHILTG